MKNELYVFQAFEHPCLKLYYSNMRTPTHLAEFEWGSPNVYTFDSLCRATVRVTECLLAYHRRFERLLDYYSHFEYLLDSYCHCRAQMGVAKRVRAFDSLCRARMGVAKRVQAFDSLCRAQTEVGECLLAFDSQWTGLRSYNN